MSVPAPVGLLAELTHRCPLQCVYCSNPLQLEAPATELSTADWKSTFSQAADLGVLQLHLSGGEPTVRRDLEELIAHATSLGLYSNLITSAYGLPRARLKALADAGLAHVQISIQGADADSADVIAGTSGAHARKLALARDVREIGLALTINAPMHQKNLDQLEAIIALAVEAGATRLEVANVQYYGWALANRGALMPTREQVKHAIDIVKAARVRLAGVLSIDFVAPDYFARTPKACMGGWGRGIVVITPRGTVLPCHAAESIAGLAFPNIKTETLANIWAHASAFNAYRGTSWMKEPCRTCDLREVDWGGCRCQAHAITGDAAEADPVCMKSSFRARVSEATREANVAPLRYRRYNG
jgi:PqqA peptide cyclase